MLVAHRCRDGSPSDPLGFDLEGDAQVRTAMPLQADTPDQVRPHVAHPKPHDTMSTPLAHMNTFVPQQCRRVLAACTHDDQRAYGDAVGALRYGTADPQSVTISAFKRHMATLPGAAKLANAGYERASG